MCDNWHLADVNTEAAVIPGVTTSPRKDTLRYLRRNLCQSMWSYKLDLRMDPVQLTSCTLTLVQNVGSFLGINVDTLTPHMGSCRILHDAHLSQPVSWTPVLIISKAHNFIYHSSYYYYYSSSHYHLLPWLGTFHLTSHVCLRLAIQPCAQFINLSKQERSSSSRINPQASMTGTDFLASQGSVLVAQVSVGQVKSKKRCQNFFLRVACRKKLRKIVLPSYAW